MKISMIKKSTFREIRQSKGRFAAILCIVALGVGLFSGLKITRSVFLQSMGGYLEEKSFYDYRLLCDLGFSRNQVTFLEAAEGVEAAEGSIQKDAVFYEADGKQRVGRFHSITDRVNQLTLVSGRLPEKENECVVDANFYDTVAIGRTIRLNNGEESSENEDFRTQEFTVTGLVKSPLYIQFERGNTSLLKGKVDCYVYLLPQAFRSGESVEDGDVIYTEIYVKLSDAYPLYSESYRDMLEDNQITWEQYAKECAHSRYLELPAWINTAKTTLEKEEKDGNQKLQEAAEQLADAEKQLQDAKMQLEDGEEKLAEGKQELEKAKREIQRGEKELKEKEKSLPDAKEKLEQAERLIEEKEALLKEKSSEYDSGKKLYETGKMQYSLLEMQCRLTGASQAAEQKEIDSKRDSLKERTKKVNRLEEIATSLGMEEIYREQIEQERKAIAQETLETDEKEKDLHNRYLEWLENCKTLEEAGKQLAESEALLEEGRVSLEEGRNALYAAKRELLQGQQDVAEGERSLREANIEIAQGKLSIEQGEKELEQKASLLENSKREYEEAAVSFQEGEEEYLAAKERFEREIANAREQIRELEEKYREGEDPAVYLLGRNTNIGYVCFENDSSIVDGIANVFPVFFFLVAALVCMTTMSRMVEEQRTQIGIWKAIGYRDGQIMFRFLFYSGAAAVTGCFVGYFVGIVLFPYIIWKVYGIMYQAGSVAFCFDPLLAVVSLIVSLLCSVGATYFSCGAELKCVPAALLRPKAPKAGKRILLEYIPFVWDRLSYLRKVAVRNVLRYKKRLVMMALGIGGCTALLITGFGIKDSIAGVAEMQYSEVMLYDMSMSLQDEIEAEKLEELRAYGLEEYLVLRETSLNLETERKSKSVSVVTLPEQLTDEDFRKFVDLHTDDGEKVLMPRGNCCVITDRIARDYKLSVGERIVLKDDEQREMTLQISGISRNFIYDYVYIPEKAWSGGTLEKPEAGTVYFCLQDGADPYGLCTRLMKLEPTANISINRDMLERFDTMMQSLDLIVVVIILCAAGLAFIVLYNLTNINITERIREIATIKVLGFYAAETALYVFRENMILTGIGAAAGIFLGRWLHSFVMTQIRVDLVSFATRIAPISYLYSVGLTFLFAILVNLFMNGKLEKISMTESLKSVD